MAFATLRLAPARAHAEPRAERAGVRVVHVLCAALLLLIVANLVRIPLLATKAKEAPLLLNDLLVCALVGAGALVSARNRRLVLDTPAAFALVFAAVGALSALIAAQKFGLSLFQLAFSLAYLARWLMYFAIYVVAINTLRREDVPLVWQTLEAAILVFAAFGVVQSIFLPGFAQMVYPDSRAYVDWDIQGHRLVSTFLDPNFAGMFVVMGLLVHLAQLAFGVRTALWKPALLLAALLMTVSRSAILAFLVGSLLILAVRGLSRRLLTGGALLLVLLVPFIPVVIRFAASFNKLALNDASAMTRVVMWLSALHVLSDNPVLGVGFNTFGFVRPYYGYTNIGNASFGLDGGLLFVAVMTGVVGVAIYAGMVMLVLRRCRHVWRDPGAPAESRAFTLGTAAVTIALLVHSVFLNSLLYPYLMEPLWVLWAFTYVLSQPAKNS